MRYRLRPLLAFWAMVKTWDFIFCVIRSHYLVLSRGLTVDLNIKPTLAALWRPRVEAEAGNQLDFYNSSGERRQWFGLGGSSYREGWKWLDMASILKVQTTEFAVVRIMDNFKISGLKWLMAPFTNMGTSEVGFRREHIEFVLGTLYSLQTSFKLITKTINWWINKTWYIHQWTIIWQ